MQNTISIYHVASATDSCEREAVGEALGICDEKKGRRSAHGQLRKLQDEHGAHGLSPESILQPARRLKTSKGGTLTRYPNPEPRPICGFPSGNQGRSVTLVLALAWQQACCHPVACEVQGTIPTLGTNSKGLTTGTMASMSPL